MQSRLHIAPLAALVSVGVAACGDGRSDARYAPAVEATMLLPDRVESFRLHPAIAPVPERTYGRLGAYPITEVGPDLARSQAKRVTSLLLDPSSYRLLESVEDRKLCIFAPRHGLRFTRGDAVAVEAIICFECAQLQVRTADGSHSGGGDFDPIEDALAAVFEEFLPGGLDMGRSN